MDQMTTDEELPTRTGVPLLDAVLDVAQAARDQGEARGRGDLPAARTHHLRVLAALAEVQRYWQQLDVEVNGARNPGRRP